MLKHFPSSTSDVRMRVRNSPLSVVRVSVETTNTSPSIEKNIPSSLARKRTRLPWIDRPLLRLLRWKKKLYRQAKVTRDWSQYYSFQKHCKREIRRAEWQYINKTIQEGLDKNNIKPFWNFVKSRRHDNTGVSPLRDRGTLYSDAANKANILLRQFKSAFTLESESPPRKPRPQVPSCQQITINTDGVAKLLKSLQVHKAPGPDGIPNTVLRTCADSIAPALTMILQRSLDTGRLPKDWLSANISSAYKKGDRHLAENYRPISLTPVSCKILEHIICRHLLNHLEKNNILTKRNHGFRSGFSCETQLLTTAFDLFNSFEREKQTDVAILDFSKAFDIVPHKKLLHKLSLYGITGPLHVCLSNFLTQRSMKVVIEGACSESPTVDFGVPQGTVLGPILFLCHINDLPSSVSSQVRLFADDCLLYRKINTFKNHLTLQQDLKQLEVWADTWGMRFNASKCYILSIKEKSNFHYTLNSTILKHVTNNPYLGILFSQDLKRGDHIAKICKKANSMIGFLRRNLRNCPSGCKRNAYLSLVRSVLEYGAALWDPYLQKDIIKLEHFLFKVVEGLVPAMPPEHFFTFSKPGKRSDQ